MTLIHEDLSDVRLDLMKQELHNFKSHDFVSGQYNPCPGKWGENNIEITQNY